VRKKHIQLLFYVFGAQKTFSEGNEIILGKWKKGYLKTLLECTENILFESCSTLSLNPKDEVRVTLSDSEACVFVNVSHIVSCR
jgi:hypothetical protein